MSYEVKFTGTRSNTNADFWWDSTDTEIANYCKVVKSLAEALGIQHSYVVSQDGMSFTSSFIVSQMEDWKYFNTIMGNSIPGMKARRLAYFQEHQHTLLQEFLNHDSEITSAFDIV
jgi:hypothetical protein